MADEVPNGRITEAARNHLALQKEVSAIAASLAAATEVARLQGESIGKLDRAQRAAMVPNYGLAVSALTLVFLIGGLVLWEPLRDMRSTIIGHLGDGHPARVTELIQDWQMVQQERAARFEAIHQRQTESIVGLEVAQNSVLERLLNIERTVFAGTAYRSGRPTGPTGPVE